MVKFQEISQINGKEFRDAIELYVKAFPANERHPVRIIAERVDKKFSQLYVGYSNDEVIFIALLWPLKDTDFILLDYMATKDGYRGKGVASAFLNEWRQKLQSVNKYFILEVENPMLGENRPERERRVSFYKNSGAKELRGVRYMLPPLDGSSPTEMILMMFPEYRKEKIDADTVKKVIIQIYQELYDRDTNDGLLRSFIDGMEDMITLV